MLDKRGLIGRLLIYAVILIVVGGSLYSVYQKYFGGISGKISFNQENKTSNNVVEDISVGEGAKNNKQITENNIGEIEKNSAKLEENSTNQSDGNQTYYIQPLSGNKTKGNNSLKN